MTQRNNFKTKSVVKKTTCRRAVLSSSKYRQKVIIPIMVVKIPKIQKKTSWFILPNFFGSAARQAAKVLSCFILAATLIVPQSLLVSGFEAHVINVTAKICNYSETRTMGYWKTHKEDTVRLLPQTLGAPGSDDAINTWSGVLRVFADYNLSMRNKLRGQLLAMKFNIARYGIGGYLVESENQTVDEIVAAADFLLRDSGALKSDLEEAKNILDYLNNLHRIKLCSGLPSEKGCQLQLTKTVDLAQVSPGGALTYKLTFDNTGDKICTGGGVKLKDTFDAPLIYVDYTSTRMPKYFSQGAGFLEWNFGSIYPDDPLIEIDLKMKVDKCAKCDSSVINTANFWSNETDWGHAVSVTSQVVCGTTPALALVAGVLINEFLPNPKGFDKAPKPNGEWVELYNSSDSEINVAGWALYDEKDNHSLLITKHNTDTGSTTISAGGFLVVYRNKDSDFALDNLGGDSVRLFDGKISEGATFIDSYIYTIDAPENKSFARIPDGSSNWVDPVPTPGKPNVLAEEKADLSHVILAEEGEDEPEEIIQEPEVVLEESNDPLSALGASVETGTGDEIASSTEEFIGTGTDLPPAQEEAAGLGTATSSEDILTGALSGDSGSTTEEEMVSEGSAVLENTEANEVVENPLDQTETFFGEGTELESLVSQGAAPGESSEPNEEQISADTQPIIEQQPVDVIDDNSSQPIGPTPKDDSGGSSDTLGTDSALVDSATR